MGNGLFGWQSAGSFAWCGVSAPLQRGTVHLGRTEKDWAFVLPQRPSPPLRGRCQRKLTEGGSCASIRQDLARADSPSPPSAPCRGHLPLKGGEGLEPDWLSVVSAAHKGERGAAVICSAGLTR